MARPPAKRPDTSRPLEQIRRLQALRTRAPRDLSIERAVGELTREVRRAVTTRTKAQQALATGLPETIAPWVRATTLARGVLTLLAQDASAQYKLHQWLRGGGEALLQKSAPGVKRVRIALDAPDKFGTPDKPSAKGGAS
jgi:hypothetical protein